MQPKGFSSSPLGVHTGVENDTRATHGRAERTIPMIACAWCRGGPLVLRLCRVDRACIVCSECGRHLDPKRLFVLQELMEHS
jgi:hypothetical protein